MSTANALRVTAQLPGSALLWIQAAQYEFQKRSIKPEYYNVTVVDQPHSVVVMLTSLDQLPPAAENPLSPPYPPGPVGPAAGIRGSSGALPGFEVELAKADLRILRANYVK